MGAVKGFRITWERWTLSDVEHGAPEATGWYGAGGWLFDQDDATAGDVIPWEPGMPHQDQWDALVAEYYATESEDRRRAYQNSPHTSDDRTGADVYLTLHREG